MGFFLENGFYESLCFLLVILWYIYNYITKNYTFWLKRGIPFAEPMFPFGSLPGVSLGTCQLGEGYDKLYKQFKGQRFFGVLDGREPGLVITDPDLIKHVLVKDFHHFTDRSPFSSAMNKEYITQHLFNMTGTSWRKMRLTLTPTFTSAKMKMMFSFMDKCCGKLLEHLDSQISEVSVVDIKDTLSRLTMDIIATCAFGLEINSLSNNNSQFYFFGTQIVRPTPLRLLRRIIYGVIPILSKFYAPRFVAKDITEFFSNTISDTVTYREQNNVGRNDLLDLLIKIRQNKKITDEDEVINGKLEQEDKKIVKDVGLTIEEIIAQSFVFFLAGFETASSTASFCLYELSNNTDIQERLYNEVKEVLSHHEGRVTYQALQHMTFMDQVINETLRLYASLAVLNRTCTQSYQVPLSNLVIEKGTRITIPVYSIHHDPEYYPEPYRFDPDRFTQEAMQARHPYVHLPFGEGPRMCIGMRFGLLQTKIALATLIYNYKFDVAPDVEIPIKIMKQAFITLPENPLNLKIEKRDNTFGST